MGGTIALQEQVEINLDELEKSAFRQLVPLHHTEKVWVFDKNEQNRDLSPLRYGDPLAYFYEHREDEGWFDAIDKFDSKSSERTYYLIGLDNAVSVESITDKITEPSVTLLPGIDYEVRYGMIRFLRDVPDGRWFLRNVKTDENWVYEHFGVLAGIKKDDSSESYKAIVNALWDCYNKGGACSDVFGLIAAVTGNAVAKGSETVVEVTESLIRTDQRIYPITQTPTVKAGDKVNAGDPMTDAFDTREINSLNYNLDMPGVALHKNMLGTGYRGTLVFINKDIPVKIKKGRKQFNLFGYPTDEQRFWDAFYTNTEQQNINTDAVFRAVMHGNTVNPYRFIADNALKAHFTFAVVKKVNYPTKITLADLPIKELIPPWNGLIIQVEARLSGSFAKVAADENDTVKIESPCRFETDYKPHWTAKAYLHRI